MFKEFFTIIIFYGKLTNIDCEKPPSKGHNLWRKSVKGDIIGLNMFYRNDARILGDTYMLNVLTMDRNS